MDEIESSYWDEIWMTEQAPSKKNRDNSSKNTKVPKLEKKWQI